MTATLTHALNAIRARDAIAHQSPLVLYSEHMDLRHALRPSEVAEFLTVVRGQPCKKPWHTWAPLLTLGMGLTAAQVALLDTRQLLTRNGNAWLDMADSKEPARVRSIPLHAALAARDFTRFANEQYFKHQCDGPLFPDLAGAARPGDAIESWLRRITRPLRERDGHAPTVATLRATAARAALDGGASVRAVEAFLNLPVDLRDDRGPSTAESRARVHDELMREAVSAIELPGLMPQVAQVTPMPTPFDDELGEPFFYAAEAGR